MCKGHNSPPFRKIKTGADGKPVPNNIYPYQIPATMDLPTIIKSKARVAIIGGGKTGADAIMHLHKQGLALDQARRRDVGPLRLSLRL